MTTKAKKTKEPTPKQPAKRAIKPPKKTWRDAHRARPVLRFTPTAWAKLQFFCHRGDTEIGGFGVTADDDPFLIEEFVTVKQLVTSVTVSFDDEAVADFFETQVDQGRRPQQFGRIWCHTHPGDSPNPSITDEETFARVFGHCDWAVMFILARGGETYARLRFNIGPKGEVEVPVCVDYSGAFDCSDHDAWEAAYKAHVEPEPEMLLSKRGVQAATPESFEEWLEDWPDELGPDIEAEFLRREIEELDFHDEYESEVIL